MENDKQLIEQSKAAYETGAELARTIDAAMPAFAQSLGQSLEKQFQVETLSLMLYLAETSGAVSQRRAAFLREVLDLEYDAWQFNELMHRLDLHNSDFSRLIPTVLKAAAEYDNMTGTTAMTQNLILILEKLSENAGLYSLEQDAMEGLDRQIYLLALNNWMNDHSLHRLNSRLKPFASSENLPPMPETGNYKQESLKLDAQPEKEEGKEPEQSLEELMEELNALTGLKSVKEDVNSLVNLLRIRKIRRERGMKDIDVSMHLVFTGNPGTGKTTVARLLAKIYKSLGALSKGQLVEVDRGELVGGYVGQTAIKTEEVIKSALGGILFIDEAYSLTAGKDKSDFGFEAVNTLLVEMENHRDDLAVIVAGYPVPMEDFLQSNPGLKSRFNKFIFFPDYTPEELMDIFKSQAKRNGYVLTDEAQKKAQEIFEKIFNERDENFANGRAVRNFFEKAMVAQANRLSSVENPTNEQLERIEPEDLKDLESTEPDKPSASEEISGLLSAVKTIISEEQTDQPSQEAEPAKEEA